MDWIHLAQDRDRWRTLVNTVKNMSKNSWAAERLVAFQEALTSMGLVTLVSQLVK
jgi:hypothetical protein